MTNEMRTYYNERAEEYDEIYEGKKHGTLDPHIYLKDVARTVESASKFGSGHLLDIACGTGFWLLSYHQNCRRITVMDQSEKMLQKCRKRAAEKGITLIDFVQGDFLNIMFKPSTFDSTFVGFLLSHVTPDQEKSFFYNLERVLKPDSQVMLVDSAWNRLRQKYTEKECMQKRVLNDGRTYTVYKRYFEKQDIMRMCERYHLKIESGFTGTAFIVAVLKRGRL
jgi:ubiquinone/menaquinone biosynthesis C-methylase UbiE